jgi:Polysaccharide biosynthesis C-terminal domain
VCAGVAVVALTAIFVHVDLVAVGAGLSLSALVAAGYSFSWLVRLTGLRPRVLLREVWPATLSATVMAGVLFALDRLVLDAGSRSTVEGLVLLSLEVVLGAVIYLAGVFALAPETAGEVVRRLGPSRRGRPAGVGLEAK